MDIGNKIKALRKRRGLTQEQLAAALNISFQSVSKWETGLTLPDLSMIPGLTRLLHVTADELLGLTDEAADDRRHFFDDCCRDSMSRPYDSKDLAVARQAAAEFPGEARYLYWLACSEFFDSFENGLNKGDRAFFQKGLELSLGHAFTVFDMASEETLRTKALFHIVQTLVSLDRRQEAREYAELYPPNPSISREDVLALCAEEKVASAIQQERLKASVLELLQRLLNVWRGKDLHEESARSAISAAEGIVYAFVPDGRFLEFENILFHISAARAVLAGFDGKREEMYKALREAREHAAAFSALFDNEERRYSAPLFNCCTVSYPPLAPQFTTLEQEFRELLEKDTFDPYRASGAFIALAELERA